MNRQEYDAKIAVLMAENEALRKTAADTPRKQVITFKITPQRNPGTNGKDDKGTDGGAISIYGLGRFPVTLWPNQYIALAKVFFSLLKYMVENKSKLTWKGAVPSDEEILSALK